MCAVWPSCSPFPESSRRRTAASQAGEPVVPRDQSGQSIRDGFPLTLSRTDPYGAAPLTRIFIARGTKSIEPPPGLKSIPRDGQVIVSPHLHRLLRAEPALAQRFPGKEAGLIGAQGLARSDEIVAYVGMTRAELPDGYPVKQWGTDYAPDPTVEASTLDIVRFTMAAVVLLPSQSSSPYAHVSLRPNGHVDWLPSACWG